MKTAEIAAVAPLNAPRLWADADGGFHRSLGSPWARLVAGLQDTAVRATYTYAHSRAVRALHFPITTRTVTCPTGLGSDSVPVPVQVNGVETYLADSMQFMLEYGCRVSPQGCHNILPCFRGDEPDATHLGQFVHSEAEVPGDLDDLVDYVNGYVRAMATAVLTEHDETLRTVLGDVGHLERVAVGDQPFERLRFDEAVRLLDGEGVVTSADGARSLSRAAERRLMELVGEFVWVTHFDHLSVPFYQAFENGDERVAENADLYFGIGEVVGAGHRHTTGDQVRAGLTLHKVPEQEYAWYARMKDEAPMVTSGFGLGLERFLLWALRHDDIRDIPLVSRIGEEQTWPASVDRP
ncbi:MULTISPECIES: amino acid--tRNA ligase-related protein [unclassified Streptomyces]|jgi:asparaginyl-tRNA synthetase|uniref:amino acid--tRNA ligase-related protein n=1 Tax=unclassified Streptomyces TaxID=2593676 RepID=UPI00081B37C1|nr:MULTISPECIES: amino acid--tRNA ligase-related protein [unclassified Streptomyces]MEE1750528.1 asparaginase [Streptomyces sp. JV184]MYQ88991.1 asparagine ligase [Streptomyces sp. SID4936]SCE57133.1 asparaginyl-tRNA synthetase/beta-aspartyl-peptidase (threonine type) [Streptomyces sp. DvalAA-43]